MSYIESAKKRASRRRSKWNLLLIPAVVLPAAIFWIISFQAMELVHKLFHPGQTFATHSKGIGTILASVAPFFAVIPVAMLVGNTLVWLAPPARAALAFESQGVAGTSFIHAQRSLLKLALFLVPIASFIALIGAYLPWYP